MSTMSDLLPQDLASTNRMSDKALFYKTDLKAGSAICLDDQGLSEQMQEILKGVTTSFQKEFKYDTVNKDRAEMVFYIVHLNQSEFTVTDLQKVSGLTNSVINKMLQGYQSKGNIYSGLLEKCPALSYCDKTHIIGYEIEKTSRRARAYQWDMQAYRKWAGAGTVWLEEDTTHDHERKLVEISATNQSENKALSTESEAIEKNKNVVAEMREIIRGEKVRSPDHTKPVTENQNSAPRVITPSKPLQKSRSSDSDIYEMRNVPLRTVIMPLTHRIPLSKTLLLPMENQGSESLLM